ncbi:hypothetical protein GCM10027415_12290 [Humibacter ginsengisoli]
MVHAVTGKRTGSLVGHPAAERGHVVHYEIPRCERALCDAGTRLEQGDQMDDRGVERNIRVLEDEQQLLRAFRRRAPRELRGDVRPLSDAGVPPRDACAVLERWRHHREDAWGGELGRELHAALRFRTLAAQHPAERSDEQVGQTHRFPFPLVCSHCMGGHGADDTATKSWESPRPLGPGRDNRLSR